MFAVTASFGDYILWYMYTDELQDVNDINLVVYSDNMPRLVVDIDKNQSDDLWLHAREPRAFTTYIDLDMTNPAEYSFQFEMLQSERGWHKSSLYQYEDIVKYIHTIKPSWWNEHVHFEANYFHVGGWTPAGVPEPSSALLCMIGLGLLLLKRKS